MGDYGAPSGPATAPADMSAHQSTGLARRDSRQSRRDSISSNMSRASFIREVEMAQNEVRVLRLLGHDNG